MLSRKNFFIIIIVIISLVLGGLIGFYFYSQKKNAVQPFLGQSTTKTNFGGANPTNTSNTTGSQSQNDALPPSYEKPTITPEEPRLRKISTEPIAGSDFVTVDILATTTIITSKNIEPADGVKTVVATKKVTPKVIGKKETIRFVDRATGNIYETATTTPKLTKVSNTTVPKIYEAYFTDKGDSLILRDLFGNTDAIRTRYGNLDFATTSTQEKTLLLSDLPVNMLQVAISPNKDKVFYISNDAPRGVVMRPNGSSKIGIFDSQIKEWLAIWPNTNSIVVTTKASGFSQGFSYLINPDTRATTRLLGNILGLTTLPSPDMSKILFSYSAQGSVKLALYDRKNSTYTDLVYKTLSEKCVWSKKNKDVIFCAVPEDISFNTYPDVWYQGLITFTDNILQINTKTGETRLMASLQRESKEVIDVINPVLSANEDYLLFTNKSNLILWGLRLVDYKKDTTINVSTKAPTATSSATSSKTTSTSTKSSVNTSKTSTSTRSN